MESKPLANLSYVNEVKPNEILRDHETEPTKANVSRQPEENELDPTLE